MGESVGFLRFWFAGCTGYMEHLQMMPRGIGNPYIKRGKMSVEWYLLPDDLDNDDLPYTLTHRSQFGVFGMFFSVCLHGAMPDRPDKPVHLQRGNDRTVTCVPGVWVDVDLHDTDRDQSEVLRDIEGFPLPPSVIIFTGGGYHVYWKFLEPIMLNPLDKRSRQVVQINRGLSTALGGDIQCSNLSRTLRLPGYINTKPDRNGSVVEIVDMTEYTYALGQFSVFKPPEVPRPQYIQPVGLDNHVPRYVQDYLSSGASEGERNRRLFAAARALNDNGFSELEAKGLLSGRAASDGLGDKEIQATIRSAYRYPAGTPEMTKSLRNAFAAAEAVNEKRKKG